MMLILIAKTRQKNQMYLVDTNVINECRKGKKVNFGVQGFFNTVIENKINIYLSAITIGKLRRGIEMIRHRNDITQANKLEQWLNLVLNDYSEMILPFDSDCAQVWGKLRVPNHENLLDKQIAATALIYDLTVVTRNTEDFTKSGVRLLNPFESN